VNNPGTGQLGAIIESQRAILHRLAYITGLIERLTTQGETQMATLTDIETKVASESTVVDSAVTLLGELSQLIRDNSADPAALATLADSLDTQTASLAAAVTANTPAAPAPAPPADTPPAT
jgi:hypothetical protein